MAHWGEESAVDKDSGISSSDVKKDDVDSKKAKTSNGGSGTLESNAKPKTISCAGLNIQECPTKEGCSPKIGGILSSFFRICEGSYVVEVEDEGEGCREDCSKIDNPTVCASTAFCRVDGGNCIATGCEGNFYDIQDPIIVPTCNGRTEKKIEFKDGEPQGVNNFRTTNQEGKCWGYSFDISVNCPEDVAQGEQQEDNSNVFASPRTETVSLIRSPCGRFYDGPRADDTCEKEFEDQPPPPPVVCQIGGGGGSGRGEEGEEL